MAVVETILWVAIFLFYTERKEEVLDESQIQIMPVEQEILPT